MTKNEIYEKMVDLQGKLKTNFNVCYWLNPRGVNNYVNKATKAELEFELNTMEDLYHKKTIEKKTSIYYSSEEGKKELETITQKITELENKCTYAKNYAQDSIDKIIKEWLGKNWKAELYNDNLDVCMLDKDGNRIFGKYFTLRFTFPYRAEKTFENFKYTMTYTLGEVSFVEGNEDSVEYVKALGMFVADKERFEQIKHYIYDFEMQYDAFMEEINKLDEMKRNPLNL